MANLPEKTDKGILPRRRAKVPAKRAHSVALPTPNSYPFPYEVPVPLARNTRPEEPTTKQAADCSPLQRRSTSQDSTQELGQSSGMATTAVSKPSPPSRPPRPNLHSSPTPKPRISPRPAVSPGPAIPPKPRPPPMPKPALRKVQSQDHGFVRSHSETVSVPSTGSSPVPVARSNSTIHSSTGISVATPPPIPKKRTGSFVSRTHNSKSASSLEVSHSAKSPEEKKKPVEIERYSPTKATEQEEDNPYESVGFSNKDNTSSKDKDPEQGEYTVIDEREEVDDEENRAYAEIGDKESDEEEEYRGDYEVVKQRSLDEKDEARGDYEILNDNDDEEEDQDYVPMNNSPSATPEPPARPPVRQARPAPPVPNFPPPRPSRSPQPPPKIAVEDSTPVDDDEYTPMSFPDENTSIYETIDLSRPIPPPRRKKKNKLKQKNSLPVGRSPSNSFSSGSSPGHTTTKQAQMHQASAADRKQDNYVTLYKK